MKKLLLMFVILSACAFSQVSPQIQGAGAPTNPCYNGGQQYVDTTNHVIYGCPSSGSNWTNLSLGNTQPTNIRSLAADPSTCSTADTNGNNNIYYNTVSAAYKYCSATNTWSAFGSGGAVSSVFTRTGAVVAASGDYTAAQVTNAVANNAANSFTAAGTLNLTSSPVLSGLIVPIAAGSQPVNNGVLAYNSTIAGYAGGSGGSSTFNFAVAGTGTNANTTCTNQFFTVISANGPPTCTTPTAAMVTNAVDKTAGNIAAGGMTLNMSAATGAAAFRAPVQAGAVATSTGVFDYDSTTGLPHVDVSGVDATIAGLPARVSATAQTAAIGTATLCTALQCPQNPGHYKVDWEFTGGGTACSSVTAGSVTFLLTWTDENAVTHTAVALQMMAQTGAATTAMGGTFPFQTALANEGASGSFSFSTNGTIIQYATGYTACTTGTGTYSIRAEVTRMQ